MNASEFFEAWERGDSEFIIQSSGSTGVAKTVRLKRQWMVWSAKASAEIISHAPGDKLLCCLPLDKVGGLMVLVRSKVWNLPVEIIQPSSNPLLKDTQANIVSLTPYQLTHILANPESKARLSQFKEILLGGSPISRELEKLIESLEFQTVFRHSYGMSETYSHVAIRTLNGSSKSQGFVPMKGIHIEQADDGCALIHTPYYETALKTNDRIDFLPDGSFNILGRLDFIINTGGVKINAEDIERLIDEHLMPKTRFLISSISDELLGERIVLVTEDSSVFENQDWLFIQEQFPYGAPKSIVESIIPVNTGGKIDRIKVKEMLNA